MGKYDRFDKYQEMKQAPKSETHPIWRGIGCLLIVIIPIMAYAAADTFFDNASELSLFGTTVFPSSGILYQVYFSFPISGDTDIRISPFHLLFMILFIIVGFMIFSMAYAIVYRVTGPPRYGPMDAPPPKRSRRKRR